MYIYKNLWKSQHFKVELQITNTGSRCSWISLPATYIFAL